jgi:hypothetical protein
MQMTAIALSPLPDMGNAQKYGEKLGRKKWG